MESMHTISCIRDAQRFAQASLLRFSVSEIQCWQYGGLEELVDSLLQDDGDLYTLKAVATVLQPLCAQPATRKKVADLAGRHPDEVREWEDAMRRNIYISQPNVTLCDSLYVVMRH
jgi:hypothetical protein